MKTIVYIAPHLSTGGMPQYLFKQIEAIKDIFEVYCIEWDNVTGGVLVVQRNRIADLLGDRLITLSEDKNELFKHLDSIRPDVVHLQEIPELFMADGIADRLYSAERTYTLIETSHDSACKIEDKRYLPDKFLMVSQYQIDRYKALGVPCDLVEYPIEEKVRTRTREEALAALGLDPNLKHVINVGLFTPRKNQAEIIEYARMLKNYPIQFHFIGNHADNFKHYWEPLMQNFPSNCTWWNERSDVDRFYEAADLFLFTSQGHPTDMETMPLVIREALGWKVPSLIYNLPVYQGYFDKYDTIEYLTDNLQINAQRIAEKLMQTQSQEQIFYTMDGEQKLARINYHNDTSTNIAIHGEQAAQYWYTFIFKELDRGGIEVEAGDVFVDLGANIGMSALYARHKGAGEIHCFEPDSHMVDILRKNLPSANTYPYAITNEPAELELYHWPFNPQNDGPKYKCEGITLKRVMEIVGKKIDYLKMDIEGSEVTAFDSVTAEDCAHVDKMMVEYHTKNGLNEFCDKLRSKGFEIQYVDSGHQSFIYARYKGISVADQETLDTTTNLINVPKFWSRWDLNSQTVYYGADTTINYPVLASLKEYKSDTVMWSTVIDQMPAGVEFWMIPVPKSAFAFDTDPNFMGIKLCMYDNRTGEQIYEHPYLHTFVNVPTISLSNSIPYRFNYLEYFVNQKYAKWLNRPYDVVVDVGANVGVFTAYMLYNGYANQVVSIECSELALRDLYKNFKNNTNVTIINKALHTSETPITFYHAPDNPVISSTLPPDKLTSHLAGIKGDVEIIVDTITIKQLLDKYHRIDLLKIDIEGGEYEVILNADEKLFSAINNLIIECHFFEHDYLVKYEAIIDKLRRIGYTVEEYEAGQSRHPGNSECIFASKKIMHIRV